MHKNNDYRHDINALRAISVIGVLLFHLKLPLFAGGFVGVDVFFVISGYLIIKNLAAEIERTGRLDLFTFYKKRARRLLPALLATVACTLVVAMFIFNTQHLRGLAGSAVYALASISNVFFWQEGGYFAVSGQYKPLLHTWSLSVEEQFYLIFPIILVVSYKISRLFAAVTLLSILVLSLLMSDYLYYDGKPYAVFFLLPTRMFEFLIGGMLVFLPQFRLHNRINEFLSALGFVLIIGSMMTFNSSTPSPTLFALIPCIGAALIILSGEGVIKSLLNQPFIQSIGRASYSLYLVHWPVIVFYLYLNPLSPTNIITVSAVVLAIIGLTFLLYNCIEKPFRYKSAKDLGHPKFGFIYVSTMSIVLVLAAILWSKGSLIWRNSVNYYDRQELSLKNETIARDDNEKQIAQREFTSKLTPKLLFIGDSHANDVEQAIYLGGANAEIEFSKLRFDTFCQPTDDYRHLLARTIAKVLDRQTDCDEQLESLANDSRIPAATHIFFANLNTLKSVHYLGSHIKQVHTRTDARLVIVSQNAIYTDVDDLHFRKKLIKISLPEYLYDRQSASDLEINKTMQHIANDLKIHFLDRSGMICDDQKGSCSVEDENGEILYLDSNHWNNFGRKHYGKLMVDKLKIDKIL